jgi:transposase
MNYAVMNRVPIRESKLRELYEVKLWSEEELAEHFKCSTTTIINRFKEFGIERRPRSKERLFLDEPYVMSLCDRGLSQDKIARKLGVSQMTVANRIKKWRDK